MSPKQTGSAPADPNKPDEAALLFSLECLKAFDDNGILDIGVLSRALGHTNVASTRNAFTRYKKRLGFGNINTKTSSGLAAVADEGVDTLALKPTNDTNKVAKKRGRPSAKASPTKKAAAAAVDSSDDNQGGVGVKGSDTD